MRLVFTETAWRTLNKSIDFLQLQGVPENKITEIVNDVFKRINTLTKYPLSGQHEPLLSNRKYHYRRLIFRFFKIIYFVVENDVFVVAIFDTRQDPAKLLTDLYD